MANKNSSCKCKKYVLQGAPDCWPYDGHSPMKCPMTATEAYIRKEHGMLANEGQSKQSRITCLPEDCCLSFPVHVICPNCCVHHASWLADLKFIYPLKPRKLTWRERLTGWTNPK